MTSVCRAAILLAIAPLCLPAAAQKVYTTQDYAQAERWMGYNVVHLVHHTIGDVTYLPDGRVFYRDPGEKETLYYIADPATGTKKLAFENARLAAALDTATGASGKQRINAAKLNITGYRVEPSGFALSMRGETFHCNHEGATCHLEPPPPEPVEQPIAKPATAPPAETNLPQAGTNTQPKAKQDAATHAKAVTAQAPAGRRGKPPINLSPDGKQGVFIRNWNLWVRTIATGEERQLTFDGVEDFGYATDNAGWQHSDAAIATWSADSKEIATFQQDQRRTGMYYMVPVTNRHPQLEAWRYPFVGDKDVTMIEPVIIDVASAKIVRLNTPPLEHRSMECDDVSCDGDGRWNDVAFSPDDAHLAFVSTARDHKDEWVEMADTTTGDVRKIYHEHVPTYYGWQAKTDWKWLPASNEFLWVSERSNWAQIYLYDASTGALKNQVTHGDGAVWDMVNVDEKDRVLYFTATAKEPGVHPYYRMLYRVNFDGTGQTLLTPEKMDHNITAAPDGKTFVDVYSTVDTPQTAVLRDSNGKVVMELAKQDISQLVAAGWKPPVPFEVKARDGVTPLEGYLFRPFNFDPAKKYPVIEEVYPGPQDAVCSLMSYDFQPARGDMQAMANLGFVTLCIDGMGNPHRSKSFHDAHASKPEEMGEDTIPDQVAGIKELGARFPWMDITRVGIFGHSGGGNATASAMLHFPDFYSVGWAESGNHDNRDYEDDWDERWAGLEVIGPDGKDNYEAQANQNYAANLKGHLMLVHGTMDDNVPVTNTLLVVQALMKANKSFDMLMVPNAHHGYGEMSPYIMRRKWDYFVEYLAGGTPPQNYEMKSYRDIIRELYGPSADVADGAGADE